MRSKSTFALATLSALLLISATVVLSSAATYSVGVSVGNSAEYSFKSDITGLNAFSKVKYTVTAISGTNVTLSGVYYIGVISSPAVTSYVDVDSGEGEALFSLVAANLAPNDAIYGGSVWSYLKINETKTMTFVGASRSVNHLSANYLPTFFYDLYFDKASGIAVQINAYATFFGGWFNFSMTSTNIWGAGSGGDGTGGGGTGISSTTLLLVGGVVAAVAIIAIVVVVVRSRK